MTFALVGVVAWLAALVVFWRRAVEERAIRWQLYRLRDDLRALAFNDPDLLDSEVFMTLDRTLTTRCARLEHFSAWTAMATLTLKRDSRRQVEGLQKDFITKLNQPKNAPMIPVYDASTSLLMRHLMWRHMFITGLSIVTLIGVVIGHGWVTFFALE